jgi:hypothetical protein
MKKGMKISYWDCKFENYEEFWNGEDESRFYGCKCPLNKDGACDKKNQWNEETDFCEWAEVKDWPELKDKYNK